MSDLIERQAAIAKIQEQEVMAVSEMDRVYNQALHTAIAVVKGMPSAQPDLSGYSDKLWRAAYERGKKEAQADIVRCKDCKHFAGEGMCCANDIIVQFDHFYCYYGERGEDEEIDN